MELGTIIYLKNQEMAYRYIIYRQDKNMYLVERPAELSPFKTDSYTNINANEYINNVVIDMNEARKLINEKIINYNDELNKISKMKADTMLRDYHIKALEKEIENIKKKELTPNHEKTIKQLEKAIRRQQKRKNSIIGVFNADIKRKTNRYEEKIRNLEKILIFIKEAD